jgi:signal transduction histidine kinase
MLSRLFKDIPIQRKLMMVLMLTTGVVLIITCSAFFAYEFHTFRQGSLRQLTTLGEIIAMNSTAALAFDSRQDADEILTALQAEPHIIAACLYDKGGNLFAQYPAHFPRHSFPARPDFEKFHFTSSHLEGYQPVVQGTRQLGTLYLKSDLGAMNERFQLYGIIVILIISVSSFFAYLLSKILQKGISKPILALAETAKAISDRHDYSVRAAKLGKDELGSLTDAFNLMLLQIQNQNQALSEFNQTLEQKVLDRTIELETANKEMESFSYSISHDLRAPLRSIHGYTSILSETYSSQLNDEGNKIMLIIMNNTKKMGQLIDDLLEFSKLGRKELLKANVSMKHMVEGIWMDLNKTEENRSIEFVLKDIHEARVDINTIKQVWVNLISNALKYSRNREKTVIQIYSEEKGEEIIYYVKDNGTGFDMKYYDKLFGVFQRLHSNKEFEGTGVGLAIVQRIITKHGGKIWADAKLNEGATFCFSLSNHN